MKNWNKPEIEEIEVAMTLSGVTPTKEEKIDDLTVYCVKS